MRWRVDSEPAFFNYINQLRAEREYLLQEALPDFRHKAARVNSELQQYRIRASLQDEAGKKIEFATWWKSLQVEVDRWMEEAEDTDLPDFDETVAEFRIFQAKEIRKNQARLERRSRKIMLDLDIPEPKNSDQPERLDSGVGMETQVEISDCSFTKHKLQSN